MKNTVYSGFYEIPSGNAKDIYTDGCLVLEGGALRGVYTSGVLDAFMINDLNFKNVVGTSAGALNAVNYVAGQIGRTARINLGFRFDKRFSGPRALLSDKGAIGFHFLFEEYNKMDPLNIERLNSGKQRIVACLTNLNTGKAEFHENGNCPDFMKAVQASASMPYVSMPVMIDEIPYLDGGCACKIPYIWAMENNSDKTVIIRTQPREFRKKISDSSKADKMMYRNYPEFVKTLDEMNLNYNRQCDEMEELEKEGRALIIYPSEPFHISRLEKDVEKLGSLYKMGYRDGTRAIQSIKDYLKN